MFWDAIKMRYGWALDLIPTTWVYGLKFNVNQALSYKRGGFVTLCHNEVRNINDNLLNEVCNGVKVKLVGIDNKFVKKQTIEGGKQGLT